jgi:hypothetical protein
MNAYEIVYDGVTYNVTAISISTAITEFLGFRTGRKESLITSVRLV